MNRFQTLLSIATCAATAGSMTLAEALVQNKFMTAQIERMTQAAAVAKATATTVTAEVLTPTLRVAEPEPGGCDADVAMTSTRAGAGRKRAASHRYI